MNAHQADIRKRGNVPCVALERLMEVAESKSLEVGLQAVTVDQLIDKGKVVKSEGRPYKVLVYAAGKLIQWANVYGEDHQAIDDAARRLIARLR